jgi:23S rRNA (uridine2552-2'-O)-methyltransferase
VPRYERKDHFHQRAKREGYRSRAAYKLDEIQTRHGLLRAGQRVADLGCWPGGWLQVAAGRVGAAGRVIGVDLAPVEDLELANVVVLKADLTDPALASRIREALGGPADVVLSDAAPKLTGIRASDRAHEEELLGAIERLLPRILKRGGDLLLKVLESPEAQEVMQRIRVRFDRARSLRPEASRKGTSERYLLALGYRPPPLAAEPDAG